MMTITFHFIYSFCCFLQKKYIHFCCWVNLWGWGVVWRGIVCSCCCCFYFITGWLWLIFIYKSFSTYVWLTDNSTEISTRDSMSPLGNCKEIHIFVYLGLRSKVKWINLAFVKRLFKCSFIFLGLKYLFFNLRFSCWQFAYFS